MCTHHWNIGMAAGPYSLGKCRLCGEERFFSNAEGERIAKKLCRKCRQRKPSTPEFFRRQGLSIRFSQTCIECEAVLV